MKIQMIAYEVDTHNTTKLAAILAAKGIRAEEMEEAQYFDQQVNVLRDLIRSHVQPLTGADRLTIFSVPEFFFKYRNGLPYGRSTFFNSLEYLSSISQAFPRVMIVAGTIWWMEPASTGQATVHNTVPILYGGRLIHSWQKERLSGIDGLNQGPEVWDRWSEEGGRILEESQDPFFQVTVNGTLIRLGVEICLDHLTLRNQTTNLVTHRGVLRTKYLAANGDNGAGVDIHLLVAAGMSPQSENITSRHDGLFFRVDGGNGAVRSTCCRVQRTGGLTAAESLRLWNPTLTNIARNNSPGALNDASDANDRVAVYGVVEI